MSGRLEGEPSSAEMRTWLALGLGLGLGSGLGLGWPILPASPRGLLGAKGSSSRGLKAATLVRARLRLRLRLRVRVRVRGKGQAQG